MTSLILLCLLVSALSAAAAGCGRKSNDAGDASAAAAEGNGLSGRIDADGSSTVQPFAALAAERFQQSNPDVQVTVGTSGTGGGFERFCASETDLANASRPIKDDEEAPICKENGVEYTDVQLATDALTVVVNRENDWVDCLTTDQLEAIWEPGSKVTSWKDVDPSFPDEPMTLYGPGTDSGTFDYFTDEINGEEGASRSDYSPSEDDNVIVQGVSGERGALGYFGLSYYEQNQETLKALSIDSGQGCVAPSAETAQAGEYTPLSRPLFVYANNESLARPEVEAYVRFMLDENAAIAEEALFIPLTDEQLAEQETKLAEATGS